MERSSGTIRALLAIIAVCGWFALVSQFYLILVNRTASVPETIIRYFSFFTILTNLLVAVCCTVLLLRPASGWGRFFAKPGTLTAIAVYIAVVGIIYNIVLRSVWNPQGLQKIADELLHTVVPVLFLVHWLTGMPRSKIQQKAVLFWMIYPLVYITYILSRGTVSGFYPYPFIDVSRLGPGRVLLNAAGCAIVFVVLSLLFRAIANRLHKRQQR
jgi:hypothetical protein